MYRPVLELSKTKGEAHSFSKGVIVARPEKSFPQAIPHESKGKRTIPIYHTEEQKEQKQGNCLLTIGIGMAVALLLLILLTTILMPWWGSLQTQWHYGDAHINQCDIGNHHLVGEVYRGFVTIYDFDKAHPEKSQVLTLQQAQDNAIVTFEFKGSNIIVGTEGSDIGVTLHQTKDDTYSRG